MEHPASVDIERVVYTSSLATRTEDIDPLLDPLRKITARVDPAQPLNAVDKQTLQTVQQQLETYLLTKENARLFTPESLRLQIDQHMQGDRVGNGARIQLAGVIVTAFVVAGIVASLPGLADMQQRVLAGGATLFSLLTVGAASLFLTALQAFQSEFRRAFLLICAGVTLLGISLLGQPVMEVFDLRKYPLTSVLYSLPIFLAALLFHTGDALYVRLLGIRNWWTTAWPFIIGGTVLSVVTVFLPHQPTGEPEYVHDIVGIIWAWMLFTPLLSAIILPMAVRKLPELYKPPARLLFQAMLPIIAVVAYQYIVRVVKGPYMEGPVAYVLFGIVTLMGLTLLRAGYSFNKVSRY